MVRRGGAIGCGLLVVGVLVAVGVSVATSHDPTDTAPAPRVTSVPAGGAASITADGLYVVGKDITAGTWHTDGQPNGGQVPGCYWERDRDLSGSFDAIIANGTSEGPDTVTLVAGDVAFRVSGGCTWRRVG